MDGFGRAAGGGGLGLAGPQTLSYDEIVRAALARTGRRRVARREAAGDGDGAGHGLSSENNGSK